MAEEELIGTVTHWFGKISVIGISLSGSLAVGDTIHIQGHTSDFEEKIASIQMEGDEVTEAGPGDSVGIKVSDRARVGDQVFRAKKPAA